jgi:hypothetical protein
MSGRKKIVCLGMPSYGDLSAGAALAFFCASRDPGLTVHRRHDASSLLAHNFNRLWCWGLNEARHGGGCDYFAMLHADVEPGPGWLDALVAELDATGLDVLGVPVPIKDGRGLTSTALARDDGSTWRVHSRLTLAEVTALPETFTAADLGGRPLLLNTGCWVCRFDPGWAEQVYFTINDRIVVGPDGRYAPEVEPEDWFFSRLLHERGLAVGCTRKVRLTHRGAAAFANDRVWGTNPIDHEYVTESPLRTAGAVPTEG